MQYIVLDMEWNQAWPGSAAARGAPGLHGEIIQIGAVRLLEDRTMAGEFQLLVRPRFFRRMHKKVGTLTGLKEAQLRAEGVPFPEAVARFLDWCGGEAVFLTWGYDDIMIMRENLRIHNLPDEWTGLWYNAQLIFNAQTDGVTSQRSLLTALELLGIEPSRPAHDALGDAYHTALICARLDLARGIEAYDSLSKHRRGGPGAEEIPGCVQRKVLHGYADRKDALTRLSGEENLCPLCGKSMTASRWVSQRGHRYMNLSECPEHGKFLVRIRLQPGENDSVRVSRLLYGEDSEMLQAHMQAFTAPPPRRRRRRKTRKKAQPKPQQP